METRERLSDTQDSLPTLGTSSLILCIELCAFPLGTVLSPSGTSRGFLASGMLLFSQTRHAGFKITFLYRMKI